MRDIKYYRLSAAETATALQTDPQNGLSGEEAALRLKSAGPNRLEKTNKRSVLRIALEQLADLLVIILIAAGFISIYLGVYRDALLMFGIVAANTSIRFYQEYKSEKIIEALVAMMIPEAKVVRGGSVLEISALHLVPGDVVLMEEGDGVPADIRLTESENFATNDFLLTGETMPQPKSHALSITRDVPVTNQDNCVFSGVTVARGIARGIVFATGMNSEIGRIAAGSEEISATPSPLQKEVTDLARKLTRITLGVMAVLFSIKLFFQTPLHEALVFAIGVAAALVPEGMPTQISVALALGMRRLARQNAVAKKLSAIETIGAATAVASDKTGTITRNEITISHCHFGGRVFFISGSGYAPMGEIVDMAGKSYHRETIGDLKVFFLDGYLASTGTIHPPDAEHRAWYAVGDPTDAAFATLAQKAGYDLDKVDGLYPRIALFPFDNERKRMSVVRQHKEKRIVFAKGAPETVLAVCRFFATDGIVKPLMEDDRERLLNLASSHAIQSLRVLGLAYRDIPALETYTQEEVETGLIFSGIVMMLDPLHDGVKEAVAAAYTAHMKVMMITGDNAATAKSVAHAIGMLADGHRLPEVIDGEELERMEDTTVDQVLRARSVIFSRVTPKDKLRIVEILKARGEVVAVTGDGVNDALSLKRADIGIAMGLKGSEVAREAADLVLLDDNFATIVVAIREGRTIYRNLEKTITSSLTSNFGELSCVLLGFAGGFWGVPQPLLAVQILAVDLIGEMLPLTFLTYDPPEPGLMTRSPRPLHHHIINRETLPNIIFFGFLMGLFAFGAFMGVYYGPAHETLHYERALAASYSAIVLCQFMNILSRRTDKSVFGAYLFTNGHLLAAFFASLLFVAAIVYVPWINPFFHTAPLTVAEWGYPLTAAAVFLLVHETRKALLKKHAE